MKKISDKVLNLLVTLFLVLMCGVAGALAANAYTLSICLLAVSMFLLGVLFMIGMARPAEAHTK